MSKDSMLSLGQKLAQKSAEDAALIQQSSSVALQQHEQSLMQLSNESQRIIQGAMAEQTRQTLDATRNLNNQIQEQLEDTQKNVTWLLLKPFLFTMGVMLSLILGSMALTAYLSRDIVSKYQELATLYSQIELINGVKVNRSLDQSMMWIHMNNPNLKAGSYKDDKDGHSVIWIELPKK